MEYFKTFGRKTCLNFLFCFIIFNLILSSSAHGKSEDKQAENNEDSGSESNVVVGFCLVIFGASLSTFGAAVLYLDDLIRLLPFVDSSFKLSSNRAFLASALSYSAGVLTVTIFNNVLPEGMKGFQESGFFGDFAGLAASLYFMLCILLVFGTKYFIRKRRERKLMISSTNSESNISTYAASAGNSKENLALTEVKDKDLEKVLKEAEGQDQGQDVHHKNLGYEIAIGIALHNFPEGVLTFVATYQSLKGGLLFGIALALHKFPEGIMIGVPIYAGTGSKAKAVLITAAASFITQLLGAAFAYLMFKIYWNGIIGGVLFLLASSILISTLFGGMIPLAKSYDPEDRYSTPWMAAGIVTFVFLTSVIAE